MGKTNCVSNIPSVGLYNTRTGEIETDRMDGWSSAAVLHKTYSFSKGFPCVDLLVGKQNFVVVRFLYLDILVGSEGLFPIFMVHLAFNVYNVVYKAARRASHQNCPLPNCAVHPSSLKLPLYAKQ